MTISRDHLVVQMSPNDISVLYMQDKLHSKLGGADLSMSALSMSTRWGDI